MIDLTEQMRADINEVCYIYHKRNLLCKKRDSANHKYRYLQDVKRGIQVRLSNTSAVHQENKGMNPLELANFIADYKRRNPVPKRFKDTSLSEMNMLLLEAQKNILDIKIKVMKHTRKYSNQLKTISSRNKDLMEFSLNYVCGRVSSIRLRISPDDVMMIPTDKMLQNHNEHIASKAIEKMLRS